MFGWRQIGEKETKHWLLHMQVMVVTGLPNMQKKCTYTLANKKIIC